MQVCSALPVSCSTSLSLNNTALKIWNSHFLSHGWKLEDAQHRISLYSSNRRVGGAHTTMRPSRHAAAVLLLATIWAALLVHAIGCFCTTETTDNMHQERSRLVEQSLASRSHECNIKSCTTLLLYYTLIVCQSRHTRNDCVDSPVPSLPPK